MVDGAALKSYERVKAAGFSSMTVEFLGFEVSCVSI